jgi:hypothetical protein
MAATVLRILFQARISPAIPVVCPLFFKPPANTFMPFVSLLQQQAWACNNMRNNVSVFAPDESVKTLPNML